MERFPSEKGFLDQKSEQLFTYQVVSSKSSGYYNELSNLYRVPLEPVLRAARKKTS